MGKFKGERSRFHRLGGVGSSEVWGFGLGVVDWGSGFMVEMVQPKVACSLRPGLPVWPVLF